MATHDYIIDNQSASGFRSDLNNALQAIVTQNSNATAPATTYANMIWYDTANDQIKKRNEANSAWITLGTINEGAGTFTQSGERAIASQFQAETGTNNTAVMTPLRAAQAISALAPTYVDTVLLGTLTTTSGSTQTLSGLTLTPYKFLMFTLRGVSTTTSTSATIGLGSVSNLFGTVTATAHVVDGMVWVDLSNGAATATTRTAGSANIGTGLSGYSTATTSVSVTTTSVFDAGTVLIYGVK